MADDNRGPTHTLNRNEVYTHRFRTLFQRPIREILM